LTRIDRLARSTFDLFGIVDAKAQFRAVAEPWPTQASAPGALMIASAASRM
jgi:hypothetical protein